MQRSNRLRATLVQRAWCLARAQPSQLTAVAVAEGLVGEALATAASAMAWRAVFTAAA